MRADEILARKAACAAANCEFRNVLNFFEPRVACPHGHFTAHTMRGDDIAAIALPIARQIDAVFGTHIATCGGCKKMRAELNAGVGFVRATKNRVKRALKAKR